MAAPQVRPDIALERARAWTMRTLRSLFPRVSRRRLKFRGGLFALPIYVLLVLIYPLSLQQAEWVRTADQLTWLAILGVLAGLLVGNTRMSTTRAIVLGGVLGAIAIVISTAMATEGNAVVREKLVKLAINVNNWLTQVLAGESASDPTAFILFLGATVWSSAFVGTFALQRTGRPWDMLLFVGFCLVVNVSMALTNLLADLVVFSLASLVLLVRLHIVSLQDRWQRYNIVPSGEMDWRLLRGGLTWALVLVIMAFFTPRVGAAEVLGKAYNVFESPYHSMEAEWQRFFAGVSGPSKIRGVSFSESFRLGQSPNLSDRVVMTVDAASGHFWRAMTYDFYTGGSWRNTETDKVDKVSPPTLGRERFDATFEIHVQQSGGLVFVANEPVKISIPAQFQTGADRTYSTGVRAVRGGQASEKYTVTSYVSVADKAVLRRGPTGYSDYIKQKYLQLPSTLPQRVKDLAHRIAKDATNPYDVAEAIESYLRTTYHYAPQVKAAPPGRDPVDYFLFDLKEDFCEYFSASMAVMLRENGIPARVVEGYTTGTLDPNTGKYVVKELDAHAWVEAYFPTFGWIEFEPTPSQAPFLRVDSDLTGGTSFPGGDEQIDDPDNPRVQRDESEGLGRTDLDPGIDNGAPLSIEEPFDPKPMFGVLTLIALLILGAWARFQMRFRGQRPIDAAWGKARLLAAYAGYQPHPSQTSYEYAAMLGAAVPDAKSSIQDIAESRVKDRYTPVGATSEDEVRAISAWRRLARTLMSLVPARLVSLVARFNR